MLGFLRIFACCMALGTAAVILYAAWAVVVRPHLPWEKEAQVLANWMGEVFGEDAAEEAFDRSAFGATPGERRKWRRVGLYLIGRR